MTTEPTAPQPVRELLLDVALKRLHSGGIDALQARAVTGDVASRRPPFTRTSAAWAD